MGASLPFRAAHAVPAAMLCAILACSDAAGSRDAGLADDYLRALAQASPEAATRLDLPGADHGGLRDNSEAGLARWHAEEDRQLSAVRAMKVDARHADRVVHGVLLDELEILRLREGPLSGSESVWHRTPSLDEVAERPLRRVTLASRPRSAPRETTRTPSTSRRPGSS